MKFTKVDRGWYATEDGKWAVVVDGYKRSQTSVDYHANSGDGYPGGEWAAVYSAQGKLRINHNDGENIDWFSTKREALEAAEHEAMRHV